MIETLDSYMAQTENLSDVKKLTEANIELLKKMKKLSPQIEVITKQNPDWEKNPPQEVAPYVEEYMSINEEFATVTIKNVETFVAVHNNNKDLVETWKQLNAFLTSTR